MAGHSGISDLHHWPPNGSWLMWRHALVLQELESNRSSEHYMHRCKTETGFLPKRRSSLYFILLIKMTEESKIELTYIPIVWSNYNFYVFLRIRALPMKPLSFVHSGNFLLTMEEWPSFSSSVLTRHWWWVWSSCLYVFRLRACTAITWSDHCTVYPFISVGAVHLVYLIKQLGS